MRRHCLHYLKDGCYYQEFFAIGIMAVLAFVFFTEPEKKIKNNDVTVFSALETMLWNCGEKNLFNFFETCSYSHSYY